MISHSRYLDWVYCCVIMFIVSPSIASVTGSFDWGLGVAISSLGLAVVGMFIYWYKAERGE